MGPLPAPTPLIESYARNLAKTEYRPPAPSMNPSHGMEIAPSSSSIMALPKLQSEVPKAEQYSQLPDSTFACTQDGCGFSAKYKSDVRRHYRTRHSSNPPEFPCPFLGCKYSGTNGFTREGQLRKHYKNVHQGNLGPRQHLNQVADPNPDSSTAGLRSLK